MARIWVCIQQQARADQHGNLVECNSVFRPIAQEGSDLFGVSGWYRTISSGSCYETEFPASIGGEVQRRLGEEVDKMIGVELNSMLLFQDTGGIELVD
jgi:hypothetical protein